jgi:hypothetical protein
MFVQQVSGYIVGIVFGGAEVVMSMLPVGTAVV